MRAGYGEKLRLFFTKYNPKILIDLGPGIYESATVDTNILLIQKSVARYATRAATRRFTVGFRMDRMPGCRMVIVPDCSGRQPAIFSCVQ
ncbi:MAG: hypothetical protein N2Z23_09240 [Pyrinomonadaceae bacterium]|nr:hypothetical protein [Pyrinomonadaceae bacterium]